MLCNPVKLHRPTHVDQWVTNKHGRMLVTMTAGVSRQSARKGAGANDCGRSERLSGSAAG